MIPIYVCYKDEEGNFKEAPILVVYDEHGNSFLINKNSDAVCSNVSTYNARIGFTVKE